MIYSAYGCRRLLIATIALLTFGCDRPDVVQDDARAAIPATDSLGIDVIDSSGVARNFRIAAAPRVRIANSSEVEVGDVASIAVLADARVVVASYHPAAVQVFSPDGTLMRSIGRRGRGPGEFSTLDHLFRKGDSLVVVDLRGVAQYFSADGQYIRSEQRIVGGGLLRGMFGDGRRIVGNLDTERLPIGMPAQATETIFRQLGERRDSIGAFPSQRVLRTRDGTIEGDVYAPHNNIAVFDDGFCAGYTGSQIINCFDVDGQAIGTVQLQNRRMVPVSEADREAYFSDVYVANRGYPKAEIDAEVASLRERRTFANSLGYFGRLLAARDGRLWVGPPSTDAYRFSNPNVVPDAATQWTVYARSGELIAEVMLPPRFLPLEASKDYVAGVSRDANEETLVLVYDLVR